MRWIVEGADLESGKDQIVTIEATSRADAERIAHNRGIIVSDIREAGKATDIEKIDAMIDSVAIHQPSPLQIITDSATPTATAVNPPAPQAVAVANTATLPPLARPAPKYLGLKFGATTFRSIGAMQIVSAILLIIAAIAGGISSREAEGTAIYIIACLITACVFFALATACEALRDIARNSFVR